MGTAHDATICCAECFSADIRATGGVTGHCVFHSGKAGRVAEALQPRLSCRTDQAGISAADGCCAHAAPYAPCTGVHCAPWPLDQPAAVYNSIIRAPAHAGQASAQPLQHPRTLGVWCVQHVAKTCHTMESACDLSELQAACNRVLAGRPTGHRVMEAPRSSSSSSNSFGGRNWRLNWKVGRVQRRGCLKRASSCLSLVNRSFRAWRQQQQQQQPTMLGSPVASKCKSERQLSQLSCPTMLCAVLAVCGMYIGCVHLRHESIRSCVLVVLELSLASILLKAWQTMFRQSGNCGVCLFGQVQGAMPGFHYVRCTCRHVGWCKGWLAKQGQRQPRSSQPQP
jgi:hypothetical protein